MTMIQQAASSGGERPPLLWDYTPAWDWDWLLPPGDHYGDSNGVQVMSRRPDADGS